jgi:hypothetical protein
MLRTVLIIVFVAFAVSANSQSKNKIRLDHMSNINALLGTWDLKTKMISPGRTTEEKGLMTCRTLFDSTYIECETKLSYQNRSRAYKVLITYQPDSSRFEQIYFYSDSPMRITEYGEFTGNELKTTTTFTNYKGQQETVNVSLQFKDRNNLFMESRSTATNNEVDYECIFTRKRG